MMGQRGTLDPDHEKYSSWRTTNMAFFLPVYESQFNLVLGSSHEEHNQKIY